MATPPDFTTGQVLTAAQMNAVGLWFIKDQVIGSAVSTVTMTNAFTDDYDDYRIIVSGFTPSANAGLSFQFVDSNGNNVTGSNYGLAGFFQNGGSTLTGEFFATNGSWPVARVEGSTPNSFIFDITAPKKAEKSTSITATWGNSGGLAAFRILKHFLATGYPSFRLFPDSGTITGGTIRVYGYRN